MKAPKLVHKGITLGPEAKPMEEPILIEPSLSNGVSFHAESRPIHILITGKTVEKSARGKFRRDGNIQIWKIAPVNIAIQVEIYGLLDISDLGQSASYVPELFFDHLDGHTLVISVHPPHFETMVILEANPHNLLVAVHPTQQQTTIIENSKSIDGISIKICIDESTVV